VGGQITKYPSPERAKENLANARKIRGARGLGLAALADVGIFLSAICRESPCDTLRGGQPTLAPHLPEAALLVAVSTSGNRCWWYQVPSRPWRCAFCGSFTTTVRAVRRNDPYCW